ncbi:MAG: hypothetical protein JNN13_20420 [Planctomycetes bacterium]|nr:hypothetical protein [Planctomycetota bacterium]
MTICKQLLLLPVLTAALTGLRAQCTYSYPATFGVGCDDAVRTMAVLGNGDLVVGGAFLNAGGSAATRLARFDGTAWSAFGGGADAEVHSMVVLANGDLVIGGSFTQVAGSTVNQVARWNGSAWAALGTGLDALMPFGADVQAMVVMPNGDLVIGGIFQSVSGVPAANIARWNGSSWSSLGSGVNGVVRGLAAAGNGDLYAVGSFTSAGGVGAASVARWNGTAWSALGTGLGLFGGSCVAVTANGDVVVGGAFLTAGGLAANRIARWNGTVWSAMGSGLGNLPTSLLALPTGDLIAGGSFTTAGGLAASGVARWNGSAWSALGAGVDPSVDALVLLADGSVGVGGYFLNAGGSSAGRITRVDSSCGPDVAVLGSGCAGGGGNNVLAATRAPLLGTTATMVGTGMPTFGLVLAITGIAPVSLPLSLVFGEALPGCTLYVTPDFIDVLLPVAGQAQTVLVVPNTPSLAGAAVLHQYLPFETDALLQLTAITATNALQLTVGGF